MLKVVKAFVSGLSDKERKLFYMTCAVLGVVLFDRIIVGPVTERLSMLKEETRAQMRLTQQNIQILEYRDRIINNALKYEPYYVSKVLSREERIGRFLRDVEDIARKAGVSLSDISPVRVPEDQQMPVYGLTLECDGEMQNMVSFFYGIDASEKPIRVSAFTMDVMNAEDHTVRCRIDIDKLIVTSEGIPLDEADRGTRISEAEELEEEDFFVTDHLIIE